MNKVEVKLGWATGARVVPKMLVELYYSGGLAGYCRDIIAKDGENRKPYEADSHLIIRPLGPYDDDEGLLMKNHFVPKRDFTWLGCEANDWFLGSKQLMGDRFEVSYDLEQVRPSDQLRTHSPFGRKERLASIVKSHDAPAEKLAALIGQLTNDCGKEVALSIERRIFDLTKDRPEYLLLHAAHERPTVREAIAVVAGRLHKPRGGDISLTELLERLANDPDKWVRIKAQRALTGGLADAEQMSPLANSCIGIHQALRAANETAASNLVGDARKAFRRKMMRRRQRKSGPLMLGSGSHSAGDADSLLRLFAVLSGVAPESHIDFEIDTTTGWKGDELYVGSIRWFASDTHRAVYAVWPLRRKDVYVVYDDDKGFDDRGESFTIWHAEFGSATEAEAAIARIVPDDFSEGAGAKPWRILRRFEC